MNTSTIVEFTQQALMLTLWLGAPLVLAAAFVGLAIGFLQALTQIQDQTLSFAIKVVVVFGLVAILGGWMGATLMNFAEQVLSNIATIR